MFTDFHENVNDVKMYENRNDKKKFMQYSFPYTNGA